MDSYPTPSREGRVLVTGSLAFDQIMDFPGHFKDHILPEKIHQISISFLVKEFRKQRGGLVIASDRTEFAFGSPQKMARNFIPVDDPPAHAKRVKHHTEQVRLLG